MKKLTLKRQAARKRRRARADYNHARGCVTCSDWQRACTIADYVKHGGWSLGTVKAAHGGRWWRYDGRDEYGDPIWVDVDPFHPRPN